MGSGLSPPPPPPRVADVAVASRRAVGFMIYLAVARGRSDERRTFWNPYSKKGWGVQTTEKPEEYGVLIGNCRKRIFE